MKRLENKLFFYASELFSKEEYAKEMAGLNLAKPKEHTYSLNSIRTLIEELHSVGFLEEIHRDEMVDGEYVIPEKERTGKEYFTSKFYRVSAKGRFALSFTDDLQIHKEGLMGFCRADKTWESLSERPKSEQT